MSAHTDLGPSGYDWYSKCTAAPAAVTHKSRSSTSFSIEGTVAHAVLAKALEEEKSPREYIGETWYIEEDDVSGFYEVTPEIGEEVDKAYDYVLDQKPIGGTMYVEQKMDLSKTMPDQKGTGDVICISRDWSELHVFDLKFGRGVLVLVDDNNQLKLYGLGAFDNYIPSEHRGKLQKVILHIMQPRLEYMGRWETTRGYLEKFRVKARETYNIVHDPERRSFNPGEKQCKFCPIRNTCRHLAKSQIKLVFNEDEIREVPVYRDAAELTYQEQGALWPHLDFIAAWANNMKKAMDDNARTGAAVYPDLKLVEGKKGRREWKDENDVKNFLTYLAFEKDLDLDVDSFYNQYLMSPNQVEKLIGRKNLDKKEFSKLYSQGEGKPTLAPMHDPRPSLAASLKADFADVLETSDDLEDLGLGF